MNKLKTLILSASVFLVTNVAMAETIQERAAEWEGTLTALQSVLAVGATLLGLGLLAAGGMQLKKHGENPQQVPLNRPLIFLAAGAILFGLGGASNTIQATLFGEDESRSSDGGDIGSGLDEV